MHVQNSFGTKPSYVSTISEPHAAHKYSSQNTRTETGPPPPTPESQNRFDKTKTPSDLPASQPYDLPARAEPKTAADWNLDTYLDSTPRKKTVPSTEAGKSEEAKSAGEPLPPGLVGAR